MKIILLLLMMGSPPDIWVPWETPASEVATHEKAQVGPSFDSLEVFNEWVLKGDYDNFKAGDDENWCSQRIGSVFWVLMPCDFDLGASCYVARVVGGVVRFYECSFEQTLWDILFDENGDENPSWCFDPVFNVCP
jgi:hypothetical protein